MILRRPVDLCFVLSPRNRGWILEAVCRELAARLPHRSVISTSIRRPPSARAYFFSHQSLFVRAAARVEGATNVVFFTHPSHRAEEAASFVETLGRASKIVSMSSVHAAALIEAGLPPGKVVVAIPGADPVRFAPHRRGQGGIGFCTAYYERKEPGRIVDIVRASPTRPSVLLGRGWQGTAELEQLQRLPNFRYVETSYESYPRHYGAMDVFVSPARLEGGPIPLLESMMANVVPVASRTGFAPDLIRSGENGFLFDVDAPVDHIVELIQQAFALPADVRATVVDRTWDAFTTDVVALLPAVT